MTITLGDSSVSLSDGETLGLFFLRIVEGYVTCFFSNFHVHPPRFHVVIQ